MTNENKDTLYENVAVTKGEKSTVKITGEIPVPAVDRYRPHALKTLGKNAKIDGFRPGHIPDDVLVKHVGETKVLEEIAQLALAEVYPAIVLKNELSVVGRPHIHITKLAPGNPIGFEITSATMPEVTLPDYKKIGAEVLEKKEDVIVTDEDVTAMLTEVRRGRARMEHAEKGGSPEELKDLKDEDLPELDDVFVASIGPFETVADFEKRVREDIKAQKEQQAREKVRTEISERLVNESKIDVPDIMIESELDRMIAQMQDDVARSGMEFDAYLTSVGKTLEDIRTEGRETAEKRAKLQLSLNAIAKEEECMPDPEHVDHEVAHILEHMPDAKEENVRAYVENMLMNSLVFDILEDNVGATKRDHEKHKEVHAHPTEEE